MMNKTTYIPQKSNTEKSAEALKQLQNVFSSMPRMVQIPVEEYNHLVRCTTQRDVICEFIDTYPDCLAADFVRTVLGIRKPNPASNVAPLTSEDKSDA